MRFCSLTVFVSVVCLGLAGSSAAEAATLRVCASGCAFTGLQAAIDAAVPGDTILLRAGETFVGPFILRRKAASTSWITIRSDASDTLLPPPGVRLVPSGKPGANTPLSLLPRLVGQGGPSKTTPVVRTDAGAHHYILKFLEIDGVANLGFETLIALGSDSTAAPATDIVIDRVYAHGDRYKGMKRGISLNSTKTDILNSYISDIKAVNADSQAIAGYNGAGPFRIINNYLEGAGENIIFGGSDPAVLNLVPSNIEIKRNHLFKPLSWRNDILAPPASPRAAVSTTAGKLTAGTHYFRVVALMDTDTRTAVSAPSAAVSVTVAAGQSATISWSAVPGIDRYRIYRGASATSQSLYLETSTKGTTFTYTAASERSGSPAAVGTKWVVKNLFELKNAQHVVVEGNLMENVWAAGQYGYAILVTPRNQNGGANWVRVRDVLFQHNIVRHAAGVLQLAGYDATNISQQTQRITLRNNLFYDISTSKWGGYAKGYVIGEGAADVVIDRNTLIHTNTSVVYAYGGVKMTGFVYTNNISLHGTYGIMAEGGRPGQYSIDKYFTSPVIKYNVLAGGAASAYPTPNSFPTVAQWNASFVSLTGEDFRLLSSSPFFSAGAGGSVPGANIGTLEAAMGGTSTTDPIEPEDPPPGGGETNTAPVARPGGPYSGAVGASIRADGTASSDAEGAIAAYRWAWGDEILINAADVPAARIVGSRWARAQASGAAGGTAIHNPNKNETKRSAALASPSSYVEATFYAAAGVPYRLWFRMRAEGDHYANDSMFVQFKDSVDAQGNAINRIGTTSAATAILEEGSGAGVAGWGWNDTAYGGTTLGAPVYFATSGLQTIRVQQREDGVMWDQIVLSAVTYAARRPGDTKSDDFIVPSSFGSTDGMVAAHTYAKAGAYPVVLSVVDAQGLVGWAATTITAGAAAGSTVLVADPGGPYSGLLNQSIRFDGSDSVVPAGVTARFRWTFGEEIVLDPTMIRVVGSRWRTITDSTAARGMAIENPDAGATKVTTPAASPASYIEGTFRAAAGVPYRVWVRMRAANDAYTNDSVFVQFSGAVTSTGTAVARVGTSNAHIVILEEGRDAGVKGWGWADGSYGAIAAPVYFNADGVQTLRIQHREDGLRIDQVVISADDHYADAPGALKLDDTIVPVFPDGSTGAAVTNIYSRAGTYPLTLTVETDRGVATETTEVIVK